MALQDPDDPTAEITEIATFNKPEFFDDRLIYVRKRPSGGPGGVIPIDSLANVSGLLDEMYAAIPPESRSPDLDQKIQWAKFWIVYMGPDGPLVNDLAKALRAIMTKATSD